MATVASLGAVAVSFTHVVKVGGGNSRMVKVERLSAQEIFGFSVGSVSSTFDIWFCWLAGIFLPDD